MRAFAGSSRKLDLYFWIGWRLYNIKDPLQISWAALAKQFGQGFTRERAFRAQMAEEMAHLQEIFPKLPIKLDEQGLRCIRPTLTSWHSPPSRFLRANSSVSGGFSPFLR